MGTTQQPRPALLILGAFSPSPEALDWARDWGTGRWGPVELESPRFEFAETKYYLQSMGSPLWKTFFAFSSLVDPAVLADAKLASNQAELAFQRRGSFPQPRPLNLDPGYLTESKLVLASTKDHAHRMYLRDGIHAEITLRFRHGAWEAWEWTYPDYRRDDYHQFFTACRTYLRQRLTCPTGPAPEAT